MNIKVKYKGLSLRGKNVTKQIKYNCPNFKEELYTFQNTSFTETVNTQIEDWLIDNVDLEQLLIDLDWDLIIDWEIVKDSKIKISKKELVLIQAKKMLDKDLYNNFIIIYSKLEKNIKHLKVSLQIDIILQIIPLIAKSSTVAYKHMTNILTKQDTNYKKLYGNVKT
jgi:hypothetical protein